MTASPFGLEGVYFPTILRLAHTNRRGIAVFRRALGQQITKKWPLSNGEGPVMAPSAGTAVKSDRADLYLGGNGAAIRLMDVVYATIAGPSN